MVSQKNIYIEIDKPEDYSPISETEKKQITLKLINEVIKMANRFDGCSHIKITIRIEGKGNA